MLGPPPLPPPSRRSAALASTPLSVVEEGEEGFDGAVVAANGGVSVAGPLLLAGDDRAATAEAIWRERERRQRTLRVLMMFLLMLLLMDGDEPPNGRGRDSRGHLRSSTTRKGSKKASSSSPAPLEQAVYQARCQQDALLRELVERHPRYRALVDLNGGADVEKQVRAWAQQHADEERDEFAPQAAGGGEGGSGGSGAAAGPSQLLEASAAATATSAGADDAEHPRKVFHYPWNSTGFYRGEWVRRKPPARAAVGESTAAASVRSLPASTAQNPLSPSSSAWQRVDAVALESQLPQLLERHPDGLGVVLLPPRLHVVTRDDHNLTLLQWERTTVDAVGKTYPADSSALFTDARTSSGTADAPSLSASGTAPTAPQVTLTRDGGRAAFQLYSRTVPGLHELSLIDGFVKLYDSASPGYSTRKDVLMRVRGVLIHSVGKLSLVANTDVSRAVLAIGDNGESTNEQKRRLTSALAELRGNTNNTNTSATSPKMLEQIRGDALALYDTTDSGASNLPTNMITSVPDSDAAGLRSRSEVTTASAAVSRRVAQVSGPAAGTAAVALDSSAAKRPPSTPGDLPPWSNRVVPFPFVRDDADESIRSARTPVHRRMPAREQILEANAASCEFEIELEVRPVEWTVGAWRNLLTRRFKEQRKLDPSLSPSSGGIGATDAEATPAERVSALRSRRASRSRAKALQDQALVMRLVGTIRSPNCGFAADLNATALRTDWETTTGKAVNYSFYMMLVCLTQILVLLRQLLHSQSQSAATRVSLLCIGWQTVVDALLCLAHIYLSLAMQPLFTAFASVAFFKLLIFCVIEMKYMAMIVQARNNSNGGQPSEVLRRQVAMLHLRFYVALFGTFLLAFYVGEKYRILYALALYSFWVPQIMYNVYTEAKTPLHPYYIYGMSLSRLVAPLYIFAVPRNFLKEVYPEAPTDPLLCELLVLWVAFQAAVLIAQSKHGARFMIPARCLPPKFDYSRPLPPSMLPPGGLGPPIAEIMDKNSRHDKGGTRSLFFSSTSSSSKSSSQSSSEHQPLVDGQGGSSPARQRHTTSLTTRNRLRKNRSSRPEPSTRTERVDESPPAPTPPAFALECSICYDSIDVRNRRGYMLAPCDHIFHRECLAQWMDIQMVCPICRTELPAL